MSESGEKKERLMEEKLVQFIECTVKKRVKNSEFDTVFKMCIYEGEVVYMHLLICEDIFCL